jgi:hypothetical protein
MNLGAKLGNPKHKKKRKRKNLFWPSERRVETRFKIAHNPFVGLFFPFFLKSVRTENNN